MEIDKLLHLFEWNIGIHKESQSHIHLRFVVHRFHFDRSVRFWFFDHTVQTCDLE